MTAFRRFRVLAISVLAASGHLALSAAAFAGQVAFEDAAAAAQVPLQTATASVNGTSIYFRDTGGGGEPVVLLHGFPETGDAFAPVVADLGKRFRLIVPDMRGFGKSAPPATGYDTRTVATDIRDLLDRIGVDRVHLVGHDIGARVAFAFALQFPERLKTLTVAEAFIEGLAGTEQMKQLGPKNPRTQHFAEFAKVDELMERYRGKEEALILYFMNSRTKTRQFAADDVSIYVSALKSSGRLRAGFMYYEAFDADEVFVAEADKSRLRDLAALAVGCEGPAGDVLFRQLSAAGMQHVRRATLKSCVHWVFEENPAETLSVLLDFLSGHSASAGARQ